MFIYIHIQSLKGKVLMIRQGELVYGDYGRKIDLARKTGSLKGKVLMIRQGGNISVKEKVHKLFIC